MVSKDGVYSRMNRPSNDVMDKIFSVKPLLNFTKPMFTSPIDNILVEKAKRQMHLRNGENVVKTYRISLGKDVEF